MNKHEKWSKEWQLELLQEGVEWAKKHAAGEVPVETYGVDEDGNLIETPVYAYIHESYEEAVARESSESDEEDLLDTLLD